MIARLFARLTRGLHGAERGGRTTRRAALGGLLAALVLTLMTLPTVAGKKSGKPWLGVSMSTHAAGGVQVEHVFRTSPAEKAKLKKGDQLTHADGVELDDPGDLVRHVARHQPGMTIKLTVRRGGKDSVVPATLADHPGSDQLARLMHVGREAYELEGLVGIQGSTPSSIKELQGKVVLLDFFAGWCRNCKGMTPELARLDQKYKSQGLSVLGVTSDDEDTAREVVKKWNIPYDVASDGMKQTFTTYSVTAIPVIFVIDKKGVIREVVVGNDAAQRAETEKLIKKLLAEK